MERRVIPGHSPYEPIVGYSRAVVAGRHVHVSGTAAYPADGDPPEGAYEQTRVILELIGRALEQAGATFADVVRTRIYITDASYWEDVGRAHGEVFGELRPASSMIVIAGLLDPRLKVEIEADAIVA